MKKFNKSIYKAIPLALVVLVIFFLPAISRIYADIVWYKEIGFYSVFLTPFITKVLLGLTGLVLISGALLVNFWIFNKLSKGKLYISPEQGGTIVQPKEVGKLVKRIFIGISLFIGFLGGLTMAENWSTVLKFIHQVPFEETDPVFGYDLSYYVFSLPLIQLVLGLAFFILAACIISGIIFYAWHIMFHHFDQRVRYLGLISLPFIPASAKKHLSVLLGLWFLVTAVYLYTVSLPSLLLNQRQLLSGANYVDLNANLPVSYILIGVSLLAVLTAVYTVIKERYRAWVPVIALYLVVAILGGGLFPSLMQSLIVAPNELSREYTNLERHIESTRKAWGLDQVSIKQLSGAQELTIQDIEANRETINNIRLWDDGPLLDTFSQLQEIRTYYNFNSLDTDRYLLNGEYQQLSLAPREIDYDNLPQRNFINERLTYTHGMGVAVTPVNQVTEEGLPMLYVKDLPPTSTKHALNIEQPAIYYGDAQSSYVIANTEAKEFHYPGQDENVYRNYTGSGGVNLGSRLARALMAINFRSYEIFLNTDITEDSRIIYHRNIEERTEKALPFLEFDSDPYLVIVDGRLKWIRDAYTTTANYPYSAELDGKNYMKNSVKVVVDAYEGDINAYIMEEKDPIIQTYASIFPDIFSSKEDIPQEIRDHIRYPDDIFSNQTVLYTEYHMKDPQNFYNKEDLWNFPLLMGTTRGEEVGPVMRRMIMKLPGKEKEEFVLMLPYTPEGRNNMISWMAARSDGENYGELINYRFPKDSLAFGPQQIISRINQKTEISQQISLWDQRGSEVLQGNLYVIPIEESILYVRPLYLRAQNSRMPELQRVIVAHQDSIAMERTLEEALGVIFGPGQEIPDPEDRDDAEIPAPDQKDIRNLIREANQLYDRAIQAQRQGSWNEYGQLLNQLRDKLQELETKSN